MFWFGMWVVSMIITLTTIMALVDWGMRQYDDLVLQRKISKAWRDSFVELQEEQRKRADHVATYL